MSMVKGSVDVDVPLRTAYDQWTRFEAFPQFMAGVQEVRQIDDRHNHWTTKIGGVHREFDTEIIDQLPEERIAWRTTGGEIHQMGMVRFQRLDDSHTRVELVMEVEPSGMAEKTAAASGLIHRRVKGDMRRFKEFIEQKDGETGGRHGRVGPG
ncbi:SRPBCC family protein [Streptomyces xantholiticus]|uniref:SRPBCC family protein n=1 Tax=Streptomyces xantholiticus TaxID=68285 RepID=A0ABV1UTS2_9ACTN|nr:cyclase [Streptomyces peucetius subsp. caesius ATCC 27952]